MTDNLITYNIEPIKLVDELSDVEAYIGESINGKDRSANTWRIKRIWKVGTVWNIGYPNGNQSYEYIWDDRLNYSYDI